MNKLADLMDAHFDELCALEALDNGSFPFFSCGVEASNDSLPNLSDFKAKHSIGRRSTMSLRQLAAFGTMLAGQIRSKERKSR